MAIALDGFAILRRIGSHPEAFAAVASDAMKAARTIFLKQVKGKTTDLAALRAIRQAVGGEEFALLIDGLKDTEVRAVASRLDKHHAAIKDGDAAWRRQHLLALADGSVQASEKTAKAKAPPKPRKEKFAAERGLGSLAMAAVRRRD